MCVVNSYGHPTKSHHFLFQSLLTLTLFGTNIKKLSPFSHQYDVDFIWKLKYMPLYLVNQDALSVIKIVI